MSNRQTRLLTLAKALIAAAWADGEISQEERNALRDVIFHLTDTAVPLTSQEWMLLEMYMSTPVDAAERAQLMADLQNAVRTPAEKQFVLTALSQMATADGAPAPEEQAIIREMETSVQEMDVSLGSRLSRLVGGIVQRRATAVAAAPNREAFFQDFLRNRVYFEVSQRLRQAGRSLELNDAELRRLGLIGGLMARVAHVDREVTEDELATMVAVIAETWGLGEETATFVAQVATTALDFSYDYHRMTREFATSTTVAERRQFLVLLFRVAAADGSITFEENEEIRHIASGVNLTHEDFIAAKLAVTRGQ